MSEQARADLLLHTGNQRGAADPGLSAWVAANAGSGKTSVLVDRVTRLLLAGTRPGGILCLTFTKAAAAEMALRLNKRLAAWALLPEAKLRDALEKLLGQRPAAADLDIARRLFARTLEAPGGLRLQTVHAFCEALLKRFPVEAGVPPHFSVADDARAAALLNAARETVLRQAGQDAALNDALLFLAERLSDSRFADLLKALLGKRRDLALWLEAEGGAAGAIAALAQELDLPAGASRDAMLAAHRHGLAWDDLRRAVAALAQGGKKDTELAAILAPCLEQDLPPDLLANQWLPAFFTAKGEPTKTLAYKESLKLAPDADEVLKAEQQRLMLLRERLNALAILEASAALLRIGEQLLTAYAAAKRREGLLDYDDLILRSRDLLVEPTRVAWVMFKLDQGIDHILVDEAQDTSPDQWRVIEALAEDFFTGAGARPGLRTVFAVGDVKQSIYSFQGARPKTFLAMRDHFRRAAEAAEANFRVLPLQMSFRSTPAVLRLVDEVFAGQEARGGVVEADEILLHRASRAEAPGRVEIWPALAPPALEQPEAWDAPLDYIGADDPRITLARRIAAQVKDWLGREWLPGQGRALTAGDVMILVRSRNAFFDAMVRELKLAGVPLAGADRMQLAEQMAVLDLLALGRFCVLPDDDLTLATVLKGPLFNFSEEDLFALCHERPDTLWRNLRSQADTQPHWRRALDELGGLLLRADRAPPFAFYAELLGAGGGRRRLLERLGQEADEPIDEFLAACISFERDEPPSLQGFLAWFDDHAGEIKRDLEQGRDEVRVMTVHGAKGLEAPVVILPDTCDLPREDEGLLWREAGARDQPAARPALFWPPRKEFDVPLSAALRQARQAAQREEYRRLLYVALTRAKDRLIVAGYLNGKTVKSGPAPESWYSLVQAAFDRLPDVREVTLPWGEAARRFENAGQDAEKPESRDADRPPSPLPAWSRALPPAEPVPALPLAPSRPAREPAPPPSPALPRNRAGLLRGRLVHRLLQSLPELPTAEHAAAAARFLAHPGHGLTLDLQAELCREVLAVLTHPAFAPVFSAEARVEAPLAGMVGEQIVVGRVDRLIVMTDHVLVLDYKTDRPPPAEAAATDPAYLRQMALYTELLRGIFPQHEIAAALLWTHTPLLMPLPQALLAASLHRDSPRAAPDPSLQP